MGNQKVSEVKSESISSLTLRNKMDDVQREDDSRVSVPPRSHSSSFTTAHTPDDIISTRCPPVNSGGGLLDRIRTDLEVLKDLPVVQLIETCSEVQLHSDCCVMKDELCCNFLNEEQDETLWTLGLMAADPADSPTPRPPDMGNRFLKRSQLVSPVKLEPQVRFLTVFLVLNTISPVSCLSHCEATLVPGQHCECTDSFLKSFTLRVTLNQSPLKTGAAGDQTSNILISGQPALPHEPQLEYYPLSVESSLDWNLPEGVVLELHNLPDARNTKQQPISSDWELSSSSAPPGSQRTDHLPIALSPAESLAVSQWG
ncbi:unnamed protein product [Pleuronectes platessa]|uniref:Uncharacterized protein n=1 Tax=Pleuronectes platessa TaxID=8262 RepID=A0A9N7U2H6_PLEPL|nr:unnamed protein product [Pleuronectes platessa]